LRGDKRHLIHLTERDFLTAIGAAPADIDTLLRGIPATIPVTEHNAEALWADRRQFFFKPMISFGSRGSYRGAKLTKKTWRRIVEGGDYIGQQFVSPSSRTIQLHGEPVTLKVDLRNYTYRGQVQLTAARLYQGQTTNFRTHGGGFAPVYVSSTLEISSS
jgi:uncharacterized circularly permuted ATP-grasp superfamily protein